MVDLVDGEIRLGEKREKISRFEVWFMTPKGLAQTTSQALSIVGRDVFNIVPVSVAVSDTLYEVMHR